MLPARPQWQMRRNYESVVLKKTFLGRCSKSTAAAWPRMTSGGGGGGAGLAAEETQAAGWLEKRRHVDADHWCKQLKCIHQLVANDCILPKRLEKPEMLCELSSPVTDVTDGGLKVLVRLMVKCSCLENWGCWSSTTKYEVCWLFGCCPLDTIWVCCAGCMTWLSGIWVSRIVSLILGSDCWLLLKSLWHICGSGTGAPQKCRLL